MNLIFCRCAEYISRPWRQMSRPRQGQADISTANNVIVDLQKSTFSKPHQRLSSSLIAIYSVICQQIGALMIAWEHRALAQQRTRRQLSLLLQTSLKHHHQQQLRRIRLHHFPIDTTRSHDISYVSVLADCIDTTSSAPELDLSDHLTSPARIPEPLLQTIMSRNEGPAVPDGLPPSLPPW